MSHSVAKHNKQKPCAGPVDKDTEGEASHQALKAHYAQEVALQLSMLAECDSKEERIGHHLMLVEIHDMFLVHCEHSLTPEEKAQLAQVCKEHCAIVQSHFGF